MVNIVRSLLGLDESDGKKIAKAVKKVKKAEKKTKKINRSNPEPRLKKTRRSKPDPKLDRTSKFARPVRAKPEPEEVEPDAE